MPAAAEAVASRRSTASLSAAVLLLAAACSCQPATPARRVHTRLADVVHGPSRSLGASTARYSRAALGDEVRVLLADRNARTIAPLTRIHAKVEIDVPSGAQLELAYGLVADPELGAPVTFTMTARRGAESARLLEATIGPDAAEDTDVWHDATVDLARWTGAIELEFSTRIGAASRTSGGDLPPVQAYFSAPILTAPGPPDRRRSLILVSLDTLRADRLGIYGYERDTSTNIDRTFGTHGMVVDRVVSTAADTLLGHTSMMAGLQPTTALVWADKLRIQADWVVSLADILRAQGYRTAAFTENAYVGAIYGFDHGFERYDENKAVKSGMAGAGHIEETFSRAEAWLAQQEAPVFLFVHTYQVHTPYLGVGDHADRFPTPPGASAARVDSDAYDREVAYTDEQMGRLIARLDSLGFGDDTLLVVTSDHGEEFGEHGGRYHGGQLYGEILHVPLLIKAPGLLPAGVRRSGPMSLLDLAPTLLELLDVPVPGHYDGVSRRDHLVRGSPPAPTEIFSEARSPFLMTYAGADRSWISPAFALTSWPLRLMRIQTAGGIRYELYDLERDPGEIDDLYERRAEGAAEMRARLDAYEASCVRRRNVLARTLAGTAPPAAPSPKLDLATEEKLRALGYVE